MQETIWNYADYRDYLKDLFDTRKKQNSRFSFQFCALKLNTSRSYLKLIFDKSRHINASKLGPISLLFKLNPFEKQVLVFLFLKTVADDQWVGEYCDKVLKSMGSRYKDQKFSQLEFDKDESILNQECLHLLIDALADLPEYKQSVDWIYTALLGKWTKRNIREVLNEFDVINKKKSVIIDRPACGDIESFKNYKSGLKLSAKAMDDPFEYRPCQFDMMALALSDEQADILMEKMIELRNLAYEFASEKKGQQVYFISNNFFTMSKAPEYFSSNQR